MKNKVMGRAALGFGFAWVLAIGSTAFSLPGCASDPVEDRENKVGTADLALSGTSAAGVLYRLRDAQINIIGAANSSLTTEDYLDQTQISLELLAGGYIAALADGWRLERMVDGMFEDVRAILISTNPLPFTVVDQQTTDVRLRFRAGDDVVELGNGRVLIGIDVIDENTPPPSEGCEQACEVASQLNPECSDFVLCTQICSSLDALAAGTMCEPLAFEYMQCAEGVPGEEYLCAPTDPMVAVAGPCLGQIQEVFFCLQNNPPPPPPCNFDDDGDGFCQNQGDCNDLDPSVHPGAMDPCGDMIDQNCDGSDQCMPANWICPPHLFGDGLCDCGCNEIDVDCPGPEAVFCHFCEAPGSCAQASGLGCDAIDPNFNAVCTMGPACQVDNDGDGVVACQDCNDFDPSVNPFVPDPCGDMIDQNCDGHDPLCAPANWTCDPKYYGDSGGCDCGCGAPDPDCGGIPSLGVCQICNGPGSCSVAQCPGTIHPMDNSICLP